MAGHPSQKEVALFASLRHRHPFEMKARLLPSDTLQITNLQGSITHSSSSPGRVTSDRMLRFERGLLSLLLQLGNIRPRTS